MFQYYLRLALKSIRRTPVLSGLMIAAIALGIGACMTTITVNYLMSADPIPHKSDDLYYVRVDSWSPYNPAREPNDPPDQLTWTETINLSFQDDGVRKSAQARSGGVIEPANPEVKPFEASIRIALNDFFGLFDVPFLYGSPWPDSADADAEQVLVLSKQTNETLFGGENSVGETLRVVGRDFKIVGVLDDWNPVPLFYDVTTNPFNDAEDLYMPLKLKETLELPTWGNTNCWKEPDGPGRAAFMASECVHNQMWVELPTQADKDAYMDFLNAYVQEQKALGRFPREMNNRLDNVMEWMEIENVVPDDAEIMLWLSFLFLLVCLLNTIGLLMAKFTAKAQEIGLRRAVGASKTTLFYQHLVEAGLIGLFGGVLGLGLSFAGLQGIRVLFGDVINKVMQMDTNLILMAFALAVFSSIIAGLYPTWRACNIQPASQLKSQ